MSKVTQEFVAVGDEKVANAYRRMAEKVEQLEGKLDKLGRTGEQGAQRGSRAHSAFEQVLRRQIDTIGGVAVSWLGVEKILEAVNSELERTVRVQQSAAGAQKSMARSQAELALNTFGQPETRESYRSAANRIARETGLPPEEVLGSMAGQAGKGVGLDPQQIKEAQEMAARLARHTPEQLRPLTSVIQQTMRIGHLGAQDAAALAQSAAAAAYIGDPREQSEFLTQVVSGALPAVPNPTAKSLEEIFEMASFVTQAAGAEHGRAARTSTISMSAQLAEFREGRGKWERDVLGGPPGMKSHPVVKGMPTDPGEAIHWLQEHPEYARRFTDKMSFEAQFEPIWRNLILNKQGDLATLLTQTEAAVKPDVPALQDQLAEIERGTPQLKTTTEANRTAARQKLFTNKMTIEALRHEARGMIAGTDEAPSTLDLTTPPGLTRAHMNAATWLVQHQPFGSIEYWAQQALQTRREQIIGFTGINPVTGQLRLSREQMDNLRLIDQQLKRLEEIRDEIKQLRTEGNHRAPSASPAMNVQRGQQTER